MIYRRFVWEKVAGGQAQILHFNATDIKLGSSTYFFLLFPFLVLTKCQVLNLRVGLGYGFRVVLV